LKWFAFNMEFWRNRLPIDVLPLMISICIVCTGNALLTTEVSLHLSGGSFSSQAVQLVLTGFPIGFLLGCLLTSTIVRRLGHEATFWAAAFLAGLAAIGFSFLVRPELMFALRIANGLSMAVLFITCESWINVYSRPGSRGAYFSLYMVATSLGVLFGQLLAGISAGQGDIAFPLACTMPGSGSAAGRA
jgi:MFS family permease